MEKAQLKNYLQNRFSIDNWIQILRFLVDDRKYLSIHLDPKDRTNELTDQRSKEIFRHIKEIGVLKTSDGADLPIFDVELSTGGGKVNIEYNKVGVNSLLKKVMSNNTYKGLIVTFHYPPTGQDEWRFSFISKSNASDFFAEIEAKETNPKKYTYIFGTSEEHRTAIDRLYTLKQSRFRVDDFFDAFNVEPISKGFFNEYKNFYLDFVAIAEEDYFHIFQKSRQQRNDETDKEYKENVKRDARNFVKRLLSRIVFLYFLQKKKWIASTNDKYEDGDTNFLENLFNGKYGLIDKNEFYNAHLTKLFFGALNNPNRKGDFYTLPDGSEKCIPFLNGGLFEEGQEPKEHRNIIFPTYLFEELFRFFSSYNFTIYENSPQDHTIAVDPEMLGHIFENLLEDNKDKGAFYTPKEIVQYMTQESLIQYLFTSLPEVDKSKIEQLVRDHNIEIFDNETETIKQIDRVIDKVKICDPAIGSGAFPMGLLQEIFSIKALIHHQLGFEVWSPATVKQNIIQNSIYGVDIEIGAVDIARLRFWLSLVVDEDLPKPLPNLDYKIMQGDSLLESFKGIDLSKVATGNNLTIAEAERDLFGNIKENQLKMTFSKRGFAEKIQNKTKKYFTATNEQKPILKKEIDDLVFEFIDYNIELREQQLDRLIAELKNNIQKGKFSPKQQKAFDEYNEKIDQLVQHKNELYLLQQSNERPYFLWYLFFSDVFEKGGFDIVIGNPPYIQLQKENGKYTKLYENENFETFQKTGDIYTLFYEKGTKILKDKGLLSFITSNTWMRTKFGEKLRDFFLEKTNIILLVNIEDSQIFNTATVETNILFLSPPIIRINGFHAVSLKEGNYRNYFPHYIEKQKVILSGQTSDGWVISDEKSLNIKREISNKGTQLKKWDVEFYRGFLTGYNDAFFISEEIRNRIIAQEPQAKNIIKPLLRGRNIAKYKYKFDDIYVIFIPWHFPLQEDAINGASIEAEIEFQKRFPITYRHLLNYKSQLEKRNKAETGIRYEWYALQRAAATYKQEFDKEKIVWLSISDKPAFALDRNKMYVTAPAYIMTSNCNMYLLGLLNSKLMEWQLDTISSSTGQGTNQWSKIFVEQLAIPMISDFRKIIIEQLVDYILYLKESKERINDYTTNDALALMFEETIDAMVYELYFEEHLKELNLDVIDLVRQSLDPVANLPIDDQINHLFKEWNEYENDLRNRIILQRTRSEYVSTIEKALEK